MARRNPAEDVYEIRGWFGVVYELHHDRGLKPNRPLLKAAYGAIIRNPFAGKFVEDLSPLTSPSAVLGYELGTRARALLGGRSVESYGKGGIAGLAGEQEHVVACITTIFGDAFRETVGGGRAWIPSATKSASAGMTIDIPLAFKDELYVRSHYDAVTLSVPDAPRADELLICVAVSSGGRLHHRVGGMSADEAMRALAASKVS